MLTLNNTALVVIDVQGRLAQLMSQKERLFENLQKIIKGAQVLELSIIWNEQLPEKLGPTTPEIAQLLANTTQAIAKTSFSCCGNPPFMEALKATQRKQVLLTGIEAHVCVYQTCRDLLDLGYEVQVVADAVSSRAAENRQIGLERMKEAGATLTSTEMALFELLRVAEGPKFKEITRIVK
ncbi:MAG: hydrolase [Chloroflexi bacterium]|nr:hydrolase [Chloroflexota bacterium]